MLAKMLAHIATEYVYQRGKPFAGNEFGDFVRRDLVNEAKQWLLYLPFELQVKASVGAGRWASVPWLAFFDPLITTSATKGFYPVFLINARDETIVLSMNQGATEIYNEFGETRGRKILRRRAIDMSERVSDYAAKFSTAPIELGSSDDLPLGYEAGHSFGKTYKSDDINTEKLSKDLHEMLLGYEALVNRGGTIPADIMQDEAGTKNIEETRRYILSRRIERSPKVRKSVLAVKAPVCECCGLAPLTDYSFFSAKESLPLDVHHAAPLHGLSEGESRRYRIPEDFLVLCPTCHRMIHKQQDISNLSTLKSRLLFKLKREI